MVGPVPERCEKPELLINMNERKLKCPVCRCDNAGVFFELEEMPVSIGVQWPSREEAIGCVRGDLRLAFCPDCAFIWNKDFDAGRLEYSQRYDNSLDHSPVFKEFATTLASRLIDSYGIQGKTVLEIGCGKGHFLSLLCEAGDNSGIGFDPSYEGEQIQNLERGSTTYHKDFYGEKYSSYRGDLVCCRHVFEHIEDPVDFLETVMRTIDNNRDVIVYFEVPNVRFILEKLSVWDVIYEHCNYFSLESLRFVFENAGFEILRLEESYGGQFLSLEARIASDADSRAGAQANHEGGSRLRESVAAFVKNVARRSQPWSERLSAWEREGTRVVVWGGGAKTVSFLNMIPASMAISHVVDINPNKQGLFIPGAGQEIVPPVFLRELRPEVVLLMNPIYTREVVDKLREMDVGARMIDA